MTNAGPDGTHPAGAARTDLAHVVPPPVVTESESYVKAVAEALAQLSARGFPAQFEIDDAAVSCHACRSRCNAADVSWLAHVEVACPSGERTVVCGVRCPICGARGTATATAEQWDRRRHPTGRAGDATPAAANRAASHTDS